MYISNKLFPGVIVTIPSDNNTRGHTFSKDLDWLYCITVNDDKVFVCLYDISEVVCSAVLVLTA